MAPLGYLLPVAVCVVLTLMALEAWRWVRGASPISRRRFGLRMAGGGVLVLLLAAIFVGRFLLQLVHPAGPQAALFWEWWLSCLLLAVGLLYLASADLTELNHARTQREHELWRDFARTLTGRDRPAPGDATKQDE